MSATLAASENVVLCILPVNAIVVIRPIKELDLLKGDWAGEVAGDGRVKGQKGVQSCGTCCQKVNISDAISRLYFGPFFFIQLTQAKC